MFVNQTLVDAADSVLRGKKIAHYFSCGFLWECQAKFSLKIVKN